MGVAATRVADCASVEIPPALDRFLACSLGIEGTSPMDRALKIADALDDPLMKAALLPRIGDMRGSIYWHRKSLELPGPQQRVVLESLIQMLDREGDTTIKAARAVRQQWWDTIGAPLATRSRPLVGVNRDPDRPLKVGYVSANFKHSSAGNCLEAVVLRHSDAVQPVCYSTQPKGLGDPLSWMFEALVPVVDVSGISEAALAARVRADHIDILIDCMGFTYGNRLGTFCERPAPISATGWGYATGTIPAMDWVLLDAITAGRDAFFEAIAELPCVISYAPPAMFCPDVAPAPTGPVRFGAFHCFIKINPAVLACWKVILDKMPGSTIAFKGKEYGEAALRERITGWLGAERCVFLPQTLQLDHFAAFKDIDLVLDPYPQTGGITTCEALHMGVPSVTLIGERTIQRAAAAILAAVGCYDGITETVEGYIDRAVQLVTTRRPWLGRQRREWRHRLATSRICTGYVPAVETLYRDLWHDYLDGGHHGRRL